MGLETGTYISDLVATNPAAGDLRSEGDDHLRLIKAAIKATFPNLNGAVTGTPAQLNALLAGEVAELNVSSAATVNLGGQTSRKLRVTGSTGITSFGATYVGPFVVRFESVLTITHNATTLICPGGVDYVTTAGEAVIISPKASVSGTADGWIVVAIPKATAAIPGKVELATDAETITGTDAERAVTPAGGKAAYAALAGSSTQDFAARKLVQAAGADIVSAATIDLSAATGSTVRVTGTTATSAVTMSTGQWGLVVADGAWPLTYHATTNKINTGGVDYTLSAGDMVLYSKDLSGVVHGNIIKADGTSIVATAPTIYDSGDIAITINSATPYAHGLGAFPKVVSYYIHCTTAEHGYSPGDYVEQTLTSATNFAAKIDSTNITLVVGGTLQVLHYTTQAQLNITPANWKIVISARL